MLETFSYEVERDLRGTAVFVFLVSLYSVFAVALFPTFTTSGIDLDALVEGYPDVIREAFGIEALGTIEGFLAGELYNFVWLLILGVYFAYRGAGLIASDVEHDRLDVLLSFPVSRARFLFEKFGSLLVPVVALNVAAGVVVYAGILVIGESIDPVNLTMVHLLSIPYLLACASIGLVLSVLFDRADVAQRVAIGVVFTLYLVDSIAASAEGFEFLQYLSPTYYYNPTEVLVHGTVDGLDTLVLVAAMVVFLFVSRALFRRRDV